MASIKIDANPTKEFFISMITRDIDIKAAILELIDNSIDGAKRIRQDGNYSGLWIKINITQDRLIIEDNCGGMSIERAQFYAFKFGRVKSEEDTPGLYTGVFGIGMKRALFRIGKFFSIESKTTTESFLLNVDVNEWIRDTSNDWGFEFTNINRNENNDISDCGVKIEVTKLHEGISNIFKLVYFINDLRAYIERYRTIAAENGLEIYINESRIKFIRDEIIQSKNIIPYNNKTIIGDVAIQVIAGIVPKGKGAPERAGWYIYCNGRMVLFADKTSLTGWDEDGIRPYHPQFAFFRGYVFFESTDLDKLPWNTTKTGVDTSSQYYIAAKSIMKSALRQVLNFAKDLEKFNKEREQVEAELFEKSTLIELSETNINSMPESDRFNYKLPSSKQLIPMTTISFVKPTHLVELVKRKLKALSNKNAGEKLFDYYVERECEDLDGEK